MQVGSQIMLMAFTGRRNIKFLCLPIERKSISNDWLTLFINKFCCLPDFLHSTSFYCALRQVELIFGNEHAIYWLNFQYEIREIEFNIRIFNILSGYYCFFGRFENHWVEFFDWGWGRMVELKCHELQICHMKRRDKEIVWGKYLNGIFHFHLVCNCIRSGAKRNETAVEWYFPSTISILDAPQTTWINTITSFGMHFARKTECLYTFFILSEIQIYI